MTITMTKNGTPVSGAPTVIVGRIIGTVRLRSSQAGNPCWLLIVATIDGEVVKLRTAANSMCAYGVTNHSPLDTVSLTIDGRRRVRRIDPTN